MIGIDLFSGAGGMSLGASWAGIKTKIAIDSDPAAISTYRRNHPGAITICADIREVTDLSLPSTSKKLVLFGGPPCQGFSTSNQRTRSIDNPKNWIYQYFMTMVDKLGPEWVVFENVKGIVNLGGGYFVSKIQSDFESMGYRTKHFVLNAKFFGVPQDRSRFFLIARRSGALPESPTRTSRKFITVNQALDDLPLLTVGNTVSRKSYRHKPRYKYAKKMRGGLTESENHCVTGNASHIVERYKFVPPGGNWEDIPESLMTNYQDRSRCHTGIYKRLDPSKPSVVIGNFRKNMLIHPSQDRGLSVREAARLQSFPDNYVFDGSIGFQQQQVGNAVPPLLAQAVFEQLL